MRGTAAGGGTARTPTEFLEALYRSHRRPLFGFFWARLGDREEALDMVQEIFVRAWRHVDVVWALPEERHSAWLFACARRLAVDHYRHRAAVRQVEPVLRAAETGSTRDAAPLEAALERVETLHHIDVGIRNLPAPEREALCLVVLGGMTSREVGEALGVPASTVRYHLLRARRRLRQALELDSDREEVGDNDATPGRPPA